MNRIILLLILFNVHQAFAQTRIDGSDVLDLKAELHVESTTKGALIPRLTSLQMNNDVPTPIATGLLIYNTDEKAFMYYNGTKWVFANFHYSTLISDKDGDTRVDVEKTPDADMVHFSANGDGNATASGANDEVASLSSSTFSLLNSAGQFKSNGRLVLTAKNENTLAGTLAGANISSGNYNSLAGYYAGNGLTLGNYNTFLGHQSGRYTLSGSNNAFAGYGAGLGSSSNLLTGNDNTAVGYNSGNALQGTAASNTIVGVGAGKSISTGTGNILIGYQTGALLTTGSNNIIVGNAIDAPSIATNGYMNIANIISSTNAYSTTGPIMFNNAYTFPTTAGSANQTLITNGAGVVSWGNKNSSSTGEITVTGAAADMQPYNRVVAAGSIATNFDLWFIPVTAMCSGQISQITTYVASCSANCDVWMGLYTLSGNTFTVVSDGAYNFKGKVPITSGFSGILSIDFFNGSYDGDATPDNKYTSITLGQQYWIGLYCTVLSTEFLYKSDTDFQMKKVNGYGGGLSLPVSVTTSTTEGKVVWIRAH